MDAKSAFLNNDLQTFVEKNSQLQPEISFVTFYFMNFQNRSFRAINN